MATEPCAWNYVQTLTKPTSVTHSCVGNFTGDLDRNLILAKGTRIEINLFSTSHPKRLLCIHDFPVNGRIATMKLFRFQGELKDCLLITTEKYKLCVFQWDTTTSRPVIRSSGDVWIHSGVPLDSRQIVIVDPTSKMIGLHLYKGSFQVIPIDKDGHLKQAFNIRLEQLNVLDMNFLYGRPSPTIVVLYQDIKEDFHLRKYKVCLLRERFFEIRDTWQKLNRCMYLLIPVPSPVCGVLIIGRDVIAFNYGTATIYQDKKRSVTKAYGRVESDCCKYLLCDQTGLLSLLEFSWVKGVFSLKLNPLGMTSIPSTISVLDSGYSWLYIGSCYGDSQLILLKQRPDGGGLEMKVVEKYANLGPIVDFCLVDLQRKGEGRIVTCSGAYKDGSICVISDGICLHKQLSETIEDISGVWSLKSSTGESFAALLVVCSMEKTRTFEINRESELEEKNIVGFCYQETTLFSHTVVHDQHVQVTSSSVILIRSTAGSRLHAHKINPSHVTVATGDATQVLLATNDMKLILLKIGDGVVNEVKCVQLHYTISCLAINPTGENQDQSNLAAVGTNMDNYVRTFSLPELKPMATSDNCDSWAEFLLFCVFEGISYLFCALEAGDLIIYILNTEAGMFEKHHVLPFGKPAKGLWTFSSNDTTLVLAISKQESALINIINKKIVYNKVKLKDAYLYSVCPFYSMDFPNRLVIAYHDELAIGTLEHIRFHPLPEPATHICHQKQSRTFAILSMKYQDGNAINAILEETVEHFVSLLDDQYLKLKSIFPLDCNEYGCFIISCSFSDDNNEYYCVGTAYVSTDEKEPSKGRIVVLTIEDQKLKLIAQTSTKGAVNSLNLFDGKLLAAIDRQIQLYKWVLKADGTHELHFECEHHVHVLASYVKTIGDFIVVGDSTNSISLLIYNHKKGAIEKKAVDYNVNRMSAIEILGDDMYLGADDSFNIYTLRKRSEDRDGDPGRLEVVGEYHLGEFVHRFQQSSISVCLPHGVDCYQTVMFGTTSGVIGVISSLKHEEYEFLNKFQSSLRKVVRSAQGLQLLHDEWRSFNNSRKTVEARNILDGDFIEQFLDLDSHQMKKISEEMDVSVEYLREKVERMALLRSFYISFSS